MSVNPMSARLNQLYGRLGQIIPEAGGMVQRAISTQATGTNKAVALSFRPLIPMVLAGSALLYHQGNESHKPNGGERNAAWNILLESTLAYLVLKHTSGVYPLLGIGLAAYRAGQQPTALDQIKAVVNTAVTMFMGYVGVQFMGGMNATADQLDDQAIAHAFNDQNAKNWRQHLKDMTGENLDDVGKQDLANLRNGLKQLKQKLGQMYPDWVQSSGAAGRVVKPDAETFKRFASEALELKVLTSDAAERVGLATIQGVDDTVINGAKRLMGSINHSQSAWTRMVRGMNPVFGYIIMGLVVGAPLTRWINSWIGQKRPDLQKKTFQKALIPEENRVMTPASYGGAYGSGGVYRSLSTPYMVFPQDPNSAYGSQTSSAQ